MSDNVYPIAPGSGLRLARRASATEARLERLYLLERAIVGLLDRAQQMRREHELTGELHWEATGEALDLVAGWLCRARDGA